MTSRRNKISTMGLFWAFFVAGLAVLVAGYTVSAIFPVQPETSLVLEVDRPAGPAGASVHAKNRATPDWILELQARNARQLPVPVPVRSDAPSFWI